MDPLNSSECPKNPKPIMLSLDRQRERQMNKSRELAKPLMLLFKRMLLRPSPVGKAQL